MSSSITMNKPDLLSAIYEMDSPIVDKNAFYISMVYERLNQCSKTYFREFDTQLDMIIRSLEEDNFDIKSVKKLMKLSNKVVSRVYDDYLDILNKYIRSN